MQHTCKSRARLTNLPPDEVHMRQSKRGATRFEQLQSRTNKMREAWNDALKQLDTAIRGENAERIDDPIKIPVKQN